jgi:hypothetical protein
VSTFDAYARLIAWYEQYPSPAASADQNAAARADEDTFLARFSGLVELDRSQAAELIGWKFQSMPHRKTLAIRGINAERCRARDGVPAAADLIRMALASTNDYEALATMGRGCRDSSLQSSDEQRSRPRSSKPSSSTSTNMDWRGCVASSTVPGNRAGTFALRYQIEPDGSGTVADGAQAAITEWPPCGHLKWCPVSSDHAPSTASSPIFS